MFPPFSFLRYGYQTADIKPFPQLTSARRFSQETRKKLFLRGHETSLKIFDVKACKVPIKSSFFAAFVSLVKTLFISTRALSYGDKAWPIFALGGLAIGPRRILMKRTGERGTLSVAEIGQKFPSVLRCLPTTSHHMEKPLATLMGPSYDHHHLPTLAGGRTPTVWPFDHKARLLAASTPFGCRKLAFRIFSAQIWVGYAARQRKKVLWLWSCVYWQPQKFCQQHRGKACG